MEPHSLQPNQTNVLMTIVIVAIAIAIGYLLSRALRGDAMPVSELGLSTPTALTADADMSTDERDQFSVVVLPRLSRKVRQTRLTKDLLSLFQISPENNKPYCGWLV